ncbi:MAG: antibiotic biosynthesis monooxygenase [Opitutaceae bacterium]|nr:antibiotic biosynthesis monooxygenase [Opitutaceae bacterium]
MSCIIATLRAKPGQAAALERVLREQVVNTDREDGTLVYELVRPVDEADTLIVYERYRDDAAKADHLAKPYLAEAFKAVASLVAEPVSLRHLVLLARVGR